jgi:hypothetical protein
MEQPNPNDYKGDGSTQDYINDMLEYINHLKITLEEKNKEIDSLNGIFNNFFGEE